MIIFLKHKTNNMRRYFIKNFWPVSLMKDCSVGYAMQKEQSFIKNCEQKNILVVPMMNWLVLFLGGLLCSGLLERFNHAALDTSLICISACLGVIACVSATMMAILMAAFLFMFFYKV